MGSFTYSLLLIVHVLIGCAVIGFVLLQHGKGADMGAAFGSGASGSLFGSSGSANFLSRTTGILAACFFATSLFLSMLAGTHNKVSKSLMDGVVVSASAPAAGSSAPAKSQDIPK